MADTKSQNDDAQGAPNLVGSAKEVQDRRASRFSTTQDEDKYVPAEADWTDSFNDAR